MPQCSTWAVAPCTFTCSPHELLDEPFEWFAVPPCEHRARALPVVGQHDEAIWPRRIRSRLPYDPDDPVEARDRIARFHAIGSGVVRDLVVVGKVHIDRGGAAPHLLDDERGAEMTQDHVRRRSREGIGKGARTMRLGPCRGTGLHELLDDLADRQQRPSDVAVRTDEEPIEDVAAADLPRRIVKRRGGEEASRRIAGDEIADRGTAVREKAVAVRDSTHDLACVLGVVRHHEPLRLLVPPAEARDPVIVPVEDARLACRCLGRQQRLPAIEGHAA